MLAVNAVLLNIMQLMNQLQAFFAFSYCNVDVFVHFRISYNSEIGSRSGKYIALCEGTIIISLIGTNHESN